MNDTTCVSDGCSRSARKRGMCNAHYLRWYRRTPPAERQRPSAPERFWSKVAKGPGCWEWQGCRRPSGHGHFAVTQTRIISAHSYSLELALGYPAPDGTECCHRCDNPPCVNPKHLYFGTRQNNVDDAWARGRHQVGSQRPAALLTEAQVIEIRERYAANEQVPSLAGCFGIAQSTVRSIVLGNKWKHVGGPITRRMPKRKAA